ADGLCRYCLLRGLAFGASCFATVVGVNAPMPLSAPVAARSPDSHAPPTVPHRVSCAASPANHIRPLTASIIVRRADCAPGAAAENAPSANVSSFQRVAAVRFTAFLRSAP